MFLTQTKKFLRASQAQNLTNVEKLMVINENKKIITFHANKSEGQDDQVEELNEVLKLALEGGEVSDPIELSVEDDRDAASDGFKKTTKTNTEKGSMTVYTQDGNLDADHIQDNSDNSMSGAGAAGRLKYRATSDLNEQGN